MQLPSAYTTRMKALLGEDYSQYLEATTLPPTRALRVNSLKISPHTLVRALEYSLSPIPYTSDGFYLENDYKVGLHPLHHAGAFYMQEPSAMAPICCASTKTGLRVIDLCASPGGKSTQIASHIGQHGVLLSNEIVPARCVTLSGNLERMGVCNSVVTNTDVTTLANRYPGCFDLVIADAPCSGEGMFRKEPQAISAWSPSVVSSCAERQLEILNTASLLAAPGGELIYSTCTFSVEENEGVLYTFLQAHPEYTILPVPEKVVAATASAVKVAEDDIGNLIATCARRFYPHTGRGEGQFMARLSKSVLSSSIQMQNKQKDDCSPLSRDDWEIWQQFCEQSLTNELPTPVLFKGALSLLPDPFPIFTDITYARGVRAGKVEKGRLIPEHYLFSAYGCYFRRKVDLSLEDPRLYDYLRGQTFPCDIPDGWACVTVLGCPLGGIKVTGGIAKNHYPKGLRLRT